MHGPLTTFTSCQLPANFPTDLSLLCAGDWLNAVKQLKQSASESADHPQLAPNTITYSTVIEACARTGHLDVAVDLFQEMVAAGECCWSALELPT